MRLIGQLGFIILVTLVLVEAGTRIVLPPPGLQPFPPNTPASLLVKHPDRSYAYRPGFSGKVHEPPHEIEVTINELGMRDDPVLPGEQIDILAVGNSFTVGYMVKAEEAWPARLEHHLQTFQQGSHVTRVLNGGVSGYSLKQIRLAAENYADLLPSIVVAGVLPAVADRLINPYEWHEGYAVRAEKIPFLSKVDSGFLAALPDSNLSPATQFWLMRNWHSAAFLWLAIANWQSSGTVIEASANGDELISRLLDELGALDKFTKSRGQQLVVLLIGFQQPDGSFSDTVKIQNQKIAEFCEERNIPVFDPVPLLEAYSKAPIFRINETDFHWTPLAHDIAASGLASFMAVLHEKD